MIGPAAVPVRLQELEVEVPGVRRHLPRADGVPRSRRHRDRRDSRRRGEALLCAGVGGIGVAVKGGAFQLRSADVICANHNCAFCEQTLFRARAQPNIVLPPMVRIGLATALRKIVRGINILLVLAFAYKHKNADIGIQIATQHFDNTAPSIFMPNRFVKAKNDVLWLSFHSFECIGFASLCKQSQDF